MNKARAIRRCTRDKSYFMGGRGKWGGNDPKMQGSLKPGGGKNVKALLPLGGMGKEAQKTEAIFEIHNEVPEILPGKGTAELGDKKATYSPGAARNKLRWNGGPPVQYRSTFIGPGEGEGQFR